MKLFYNEQEDTHKNVKIIQQLKCDEVDSLGYADSDSCKNNDFFSLIHY